jgi:hypothetical protein
MVFDQAESEYCFTFHDNKKIKTKRNMEKLILVEKEA